MANKKVDLSTTTSITTSYEGEAASGYINAAILSGNTLNTGAITIKPNVKKSSILKKLNTGDVIAAATCDFDATSDVTITEKKITPVELQVNMQLCKKPFREDYNAAEMGYSAHDVLPKSFSDFFIADVSSIVARDVEKMIYQGTAADVNSFPGLIELATNDSDVLDVAGTTIDETNVIAELKKVYNKIPDELRGSESLRIFIPQNVYGAYTMALGEAHFLDRSHNQDLGDLQFAGVKLFVANGLPSNVMFAFEKENVVFATGLFNDYNEVKVLDMAEIDGSQNVRFVMRFTGAVDFVHGKEIVKYE